MRANSLCGVVLAGFLSSSAGASVIISSAPTSNMSCSGGVCTATAASAVLNVTDLQTMLAGGNASVVSGSVASDIDIEASLSWAGANRLTLDSFHGIAFDMPVSITGGGGLTITTNDGGTGGDFAFAASAYADFWDLSSSLTINGTAYTLENDLGTLASAIAASPSGAFALARNYDASVNGVYPQAPIMTEFAGSFEGLGHTLSNLAVDATKKQRGGLFDFVAGGVLRDLSLTSVSIRSGSSGALAGDNDGAAIIQCASSGSVRAIGAAGAAGGLAGVQQGGYILRAHSSATVRANGSNSWGGGLVGEMLNNSSMTGIFSSYATGNVSAANAGGIAGHFQGTTMDRSYATGAVRGASAGGLVGYNQGTITRSFATGPVSGKGAGGAVGSAFGGAIDQSFATGNVKSDAAGTAGGLVAGGTINISNSYATGSVQGGASSYDGGLMGFGGGVGMTVTTSYSTGRVHADGAAFAGGYEGKGGGFANTFGYWDMNTSGFGRNHGIGGCENNKCRQGVTGLTTVQLQSALPAGFDPAIWGQSPSINNGYPYLLANPPR